MMDVKCAQKHYASKYRVDMIVKALRKVQAYCDGQLHACHECVFGMPRRQSASSAERTHSPGILMMLVMPPQIPASVGRECNQS